MATGNVAADYTWLPRKFLNKVVEYKSFEDDSSFKATIRTTASTKGEMAAWLHDFELRTKTKWLVRLTYPHLQRLSYRIDYVCQHSAFNKHDTKRASKNCSCGAKLSQKVNVVTQKTKQSNPYIKVGLHDCVIVCMHSFNKQSDYKKYGEV
jgi:hypothetical protein